MSYWQLLYHIVCVTKNLAPLLTAESEPLVYGFLRAKALGLGATVFALNGVADHVHLVAAIPPKIAVATFIGQIKAVAAAKFNRTGISPLPFAWQDGYGACSLDKERLGDYVDYVDRQKEHHAQATTISVLEQLTDTRVQS